ncbi:TfoX-like protein [Paraburkholderia sp. BL23I1N1]|uniref:TfoX/Sxy family protein n=1 Tax=Paraburkholderia sp. BL23I1N1 TaxID=1938802 RepID=UPI000E73BCEC|nr:TfoX/Sxy family protein [Paraburkholderia sp. BL23I1N1]RKE25246.1 TfoX-like protein [Paraburkholderia sp. BL23I1N1]
MQKLNQDESISLLASLRAVASQYDDIHERAMFGCPGFFAGTSMVACVYGDQIVLKLPADRVTTLLQTPGCSYFKPYDRTPMRQWLAFGTSSPAFSALAVLFEEAVSFAKAPSPNGKRRVKATTKR